jgi:hypothetical protein
MERSIFYRAGIIIQVHPWVGTATMTAPGDVDLLYTVELYPEKGYISRLVESFIGCFNHS